MRKTGIAQALFPRIRQQILSKLLLDPERAWYLSDLAHALETTASSLQRELANLTEVGILIKTRDGNRTYYKADAACPVFPDLRQLFVKTVGLVDQVRDALLPFEKQMRFAFIFGSIASGEERSLSDIDLLVVGATAVLKLASALKPVEKRLGRPINITLYAETQFETKVESGSHFLGVVLHGPKLFIIGSERDLESVADLGSRETSSNDEARTG